MIKGSILICRIHSIKQEYIDMGMDNEDNWIWAEAFIDLDSVYAWGESLQFPGKTLIQVYGEQWLTDLDYDHFKYQLVEAKNKLHRALKDTKLA